MIWTLQVSKAASARPRHHQGSPWASLVGGIVHMKNSRVISGLMSIGRPDGGYPELNGARERVLALHPNFDPGREGILAAIGK